MRTSILLPLLLASLASTPAFAQRVSLADRVAALEARANNNQANVELLNQLTQLRSELQALRAQVEELQQQNQQLQSTAKAQYLDLDDRLNRLIEAISDKSLGLDDVEPDIIGRSYEYLIRKFAEGSVSSAGEFFTPTQVGFVIAHIMDPEPGMTVYDPCCGSGGLLIKCQIVLEGKQRTNPHRTDDPLKLYGQESGGDTWALANMNMIIHDMEGEIERGDTFTAPKFLEGGGRWKPIHRLIVDSATYRQASAAGVDRRRLDADDRLLSRGPRFRVEAETVRDIALSAAGLLDRTIGGPGVFPPLPAGAR